MSYSITAFRSDAAEIGATSPSACGFETHAAGSTVCIRSARSAAEPGSAEEESGLDLSALEGKTVRVVPKGGMMTMDYREDRLTILLDEDERIERAYVG